MVQGVLLYLILLLQDKKYSERVDGGLISGRVVGPGLLLAGPPRRHQRIWTNLPQEIGRRGYYTKKEELEYRHPVDHQRCLTSYIPNR